MIIDSLNKKLDNSILHFEKELSSIRTSRATISMLDNILIEAYGSKTPINQLGNISIPDSSTLTIQVWDSSLIKSIETGILDSNLGINPQSDGAIIRLSVPKLSEERRNELSKVSSQYSENAKVVIRNIRREFIDLTKSEEKDKKISQDEMKKNIDEIQKKIDQYIKKIEDINSIKITEILKV